MYHNPLSTIDPLSLLEKTRKASIILYVRNIEIEPEKYTRHDDYNFPNSGKEFNRYASYKVIEVLKGKYDEEFLRIDFKKVNGNSPSSVRYPYAKSEPNEEVVFFLYKNITLVRGHQGKVNLDKTKLNDIKKIVKYSLDYADLDEPKRLQSIIDLINTISFQRSSLFGDLRKVDNNKYGIEISTLLYNDDPVVRHAALSALRGTQIKSLVPIIIEFSKNKSSGFRRNAALVLGGIDDDRSENALRNLTKDVNDGVRAQAILNLPKTEDNIEFLIIALNDSSAYVRNAGLNSLRDIKTEESTQAIISILDDEDSSVRHKAFRILAYHGTSAALSAIIDALMNNDVTIQNVAMGAISHQSRNWPNSVNDPIIIDLIIGIVKNSNSIRQKSVGIRALGYLNTKKALPLLKNNLINDSRNIRIASARAIVSMNEISLIDYMEKILENEKDKNVAKQLQGSINSLRNSKSNRH